MRFLGNIEARTDVKGRVFLPSVFRKEMEAAGVDTLVMRKDVFQRCLVLYPEEVWNEMMHSMRERLSRWDPRQQQVYRQFVSDAEIVTLDSNGRFLLSRRCQEFAGIIQQVSFIGMGDSIEIWAREKTEQPFMDQEAFGEALSELLRD
ncbi:MAG: division/cell wall cluster transcriptional repressor MraZ [Prevotella sp.]